MSPCVLSRLTNCNARSTVYERSIEFDSPCSIESVYKQCHGKYHFLATSSSYTRVHRLAMHRQSLDPVSFISLFLISLDYTRIVLL